MRKFLLFVLILLPTLLTAQVIVRDTTIIWHTFQYELNDDNTVNWHTSTEFDTVSKVLSGIIIENKYLKATVVPEFGGRIISLIYKPTGKEELYQNPCGTPYGVNEDWFYYKWLMVYGGLFPTLTEPEHGKAWLLPWEDTFLRQTEDTVSLQMSWQDTIDLAGINTGKWRYGETNLKCEFTVTLIKGASSLKVDVALYNDSDDQLDYEYWTCLTLAPGSEPGNPMCTYGTELIIPATKIKIPSWYPDIAGQEQHIPGEQGIYTFTKLRYWRNWPNDGIAYVWDDPNENYWGVINQDKGEGIIRISDNNITPGIKMWAWGYPQSQNINPFQNPNETHRPYVELWAGHSNEFFAPAQITGNTVKHWKEIYIPSVGLSDVDIANDEILADLSINEGNVVSLEFVSTRPENNLNVTIEITGHSPQVLFSDTIEPDPVNGNQIHVNLPANQTWILGDSLKYTITDSISGNNLTSSIPIDTITTGISDNLNAGVNDFQLYQNYPNPFNPVTSIIYQVNNSVYVTIKVFDVLGNEVRTLISEEKAPGKYKINFDGSNLSSGIYYYHMRAGNFIQMKKMILLK